MSDSTPVSPHSGETPLLQTIGLTKRYGTFLANDSVDIDVRPQEIHALLGENGAGKSTLIKILAGAVAPDGGEIRLEGRSVRIVSPADAHRRGLRFIHQELNVVMALSVAENIFLGRPYPSRLGLIDWRALHARASACLAALGVSHIPPTARMSRS